MIALLGRVALVESFASWLMNELVERGKTPADLGRALDRPSSTISSWTRPANGKMPTAFYARAIAKFLDLPAEEVLERAGHVVATPTPTDGAIVQFTDPSNPDNRLAQRQAELSALVARKLAEYAEEDRKEAERQAQSTEE